MPLWFPTSRPSRDVGKFHRRPSVGLHNAAGDTYLGWAIQLVQHRTGTAVKRERYHAVVFDADGQRRAYLQGFSNLRQASAAARSWIDDAEATSARRASLNEPEFVT